jgi:hypothetical protein
LEESRSAAEYYNLSPALFWSIVAVASRRYKGNLELLTQLAPALGELIWTVMAAKAMSLAHVQALLLMSCWPLPDVHLWTDKSLIFINTALITAMHIGLHRPGREAEYSKLKLHIDEAARLERTRTWIACVAESQKYFSRTVIYMASFLTSSRLSMMFGHMPLVHMNDCTIHNVCQNGSMMNLPSELIANLKIQRCCNSGLQTLTSNYDNPFGLPGQDDTPLVVSGINHKLNGLHTSLKSEISYINALRLDFSKLFFQCTSFLYDDMTTQRMTSILDAFSTASSLLTKLVSHPDSHKVLKYAPARTCDLIMMASMVVFRVLHSSYATLALLDFSAGHVLYSAAAILVRQASVQYKENDMAVRISEMMTKLWHWAEDDTELRESPPKLLVKSRIGSSILYDCLIIFRRYQVRRNPELGELQTGENVEASQYCDQEQLNPLISGALPGPTFNTTMHTHGPVFVMNGFEMPTAEPQSHSLSDSVQDWDLSNMAWVDNFECPGLFDVPQF